MSADTQPDAASATAIDLTITPDAMVKICEVLTQQDLGDDERNLRIFVQGGGCGGPGYGMAFDAVQEGDVEMDQGDLHIVIDEHSARLVNGATVDFVETQKITGFKITNPNLKELAGCECSSGGCD